MNGGVYLCDKCGYSIGHFSSENYTRLPCVNCEGWMHLTDGGKSDSKTKVRISVMSTTIFYILLVMLTSAPFNIFWLIIAIIVDVAVMNYRSDPEDDY